MAPWRRASVPIHTGTGGTTTRREKKPPQRQVFMRRVPATGRGKDGGRTEHEEKVWKVSARPRTRGGRDRRQTKAADEDGNRRDGNRTAPHLTRRALLTPTPPMGAHSALTSALPPLRPHAPCMCASARAPVLVRNGERRGPAMKRKVEYLAKKSFHSHSRRGKKVRARCVRYERADPFKV